MVPFTSSLDHGLYYPGCALDYRWTRWKTEHALVVLKFWRWRLCVGWHDSWRGVSQSAVLRLMRIILMTFLLFKLLNF